MRIRAFHISTITSGQITSGGATLWSVTVNTGGAGGLLKLYNDTSAVAANLIASIDLTNVINPWYGVYCPTGIFFVVSVAAADITVGYE